MPTSSGYSRSLSFSRFAFARRLVSALHQPCVGDEVADSWKAVDVMDFVEDHQGEDFPDAGNSAKQVNGYRIMFGNLCIDLSFDSEDLRVKGVQESGIHPDGATDHRVGESVFDTGAIRAAIYALFERGQAILGIGVLEIGR